MERNSACITTEATLCSSRSTIKEDELVVKPNKITYIDYFTHKKLKTPML